MGGGSRGDRRGESGSGAQVVFPAQPDNGPSATRFGAVTWTSGNPAAPAVSV
jgi:hypothetical protein